MERHSCKLSRARGRRPVVLLSVIVAGLFGVSACSAYPHVDEYKNLYAGVSGQGESVDADDSDVKIVHLSHSNLLFFDNEDSVLIDGYFSRPSGMFCNQKGCKQNVKESTDRIEQQYGLKTISVVAPLHSHFDHAMDVGEVSYLTCAQVLGSPSTEMIFKGWRAPDGGEPLEKCNIKLRNEKKNDPDYRFFEPAYIYKKYEYGNFSIMLLPGKHVSPNIAEGPIDDIIPINTPNIKYNSGEVYNILVSHRSGFSALVVGSSGVPEYRLWPEIDVDIVFLGVAGVGKSGRSIVESNRFLRAVIDQPKADLVIPIHWDTFFGPVSDPPKKIDGLAGGVGRPERSLFRTCDYVTKSEGRSIVFLPFFELFSANKLLKLARAENKHPCPD